MEQQVILLMDELALQNEPIAAPAPVAPPARATRPRQVQQTPVQ